MKYVLDTHIWIWWNMHPQKLSDKILSLLSTTDSYEELLLSAISPWEFSKLLEKERIGISCNPEEWIAESRYDVTDDFIRYAQPLIGTDWPSIPLVGGLQRFTQFEMTFAEAKLGDYVPQGYRK